MTKLKQPVEPSETFGLIPTLPPRNSFAWRALFMLVGDRDLDHPTFANETGSWRLAAVVYQLRKLGWPVQSKTRMAPTSTCPNRRLTVYRLDFGDLDEPVGSREGART